MAKKKTKRASHKSFKLSSHGYSPLQVYFLLVVAVSVGLLVGWLLKDQAAQVLGISTY